MASRLKWVKGMLREVWADGRYGCNGSDGRLKGFSQFIRLLNYNHAEYSSRSGSVRDKIRRGAPEDSAHEHLQDDSKLREAVASLIDRASQGNFIKSFSYVDVLRGCFEQRNLDLVMQVHHCVKNSSMEENPYVINNLLKCYIGCGRLQIAEELFNKFLFKSIVTWNIMIGGYAENDRPEDAVAVYKELREKGVRPNAITFLTLLKACATPSALQQGKEFHAHIVHEDFLSDVRVGSALLSMYVKCGSIEDAKAVFNGMENRNLISWNAMIGGLAQNGRGHESFSLFHQMQMEGFTPDSTTYLCILNSARAHPEDLAWVKEVHRYAKTSGFAQVVRVSNAFIHMYAQCGSVDDARLVFESMMKRDAISWNAMIGGLAHNGRGHEAFSCFNQMLSEGYVPDAITYMSILNSNACEGALGWVKEVHTHVARLRFKADLRVDNAFIHMYAKSGSIEDARIVFDRIEKRSVSSWNAMIGGLVEHGLGREAFSLFLQMQSEGFTPDSITYLSILNPCSSSGCLEWVKEVHAHAMKAGLEDDVRVGNALIHMYAKMGRLAEAKQVFDRKPERNIISWNAMIGGLAQHGHGREALQLFEEMKLNRVEPSRISFVTVMSACSHAGLVDEGRFQFMSLTGDYGFEPELEHHNCMVDVLGRAGHLEEAELFIANMPIKPDKVTWMTFLGACKVYNNIQLAEHAAKECLKLDPLEPSSYVILSNVYAAVGKWDQRTLVRRMMEERGIRKDAGRCWIEVDNKVHYFVSGDKSHPEITEIHVMLNSLLEKIKAEGYIPDTRLVLWNIDEEDKESTLCFHSEKLAIAYGLLYVTPGKLIRIYKNLRMCLDCHTATKFISKITAREIVARDASRFHHFTNGVCSCEDYW